MTNKRLVEDLEAIFEGRIPEGMMLVRTTYGSKDVEIYGVNLRGFKIPLDKIDKFIGDLEKTCTNAETLYSIAEEDRPAMLIPGFKLSKTVQYLREARDVGIKFASYNQLF